MNIDKIVKIKFFKINPRKTCSSMVSFWGRNSNWIFIFSLVFFLAIGVDIWYRDVYKFQWSEARKAEYINSRNRSINLQEEKFKAVLSEIEKRQINFNIEEKKSDLSAENQAAPVNNSGTAGSNSVRKKTAQTIAPNAGGATNDKNSSPFNPIRDIFK